MLGCVNAVERLFAASFPEQASSSNVSAKGGAFQRALQRNDNVKTLYNHNWSRDGRQRTATLSSEDNIGLKITCNSWNWTQRNSRGTQGEEIFVASRSALRTETLTNTQKTA